MGETAAAKAAGRFSVMALRRTPRQQWLHRALGSHQPAGVASLPSAMHLLRRPSPNTQACLQLLWSDER